MLETQHDVPAETTAKMKSDMSAYKASIAQTQSRDYCADDRAGSKAWDLSATRRDI